MNFHLGKPILAMLALSVVSGTAIVLHRTPPAQDMNVWVFADPHARAYRDLAPQFETQTGKTLGVHLIGGRALNVRLTSLFMSGTHAREIPDLAEIEISSIGRYFRPAVSEIGFLPLNRYLESSGWREISSPDAPGRAGWNALLKADGKIYSHNGKRWTPNPARIRPDAWIDRIVRSRFAPWSKGGVIYGVPHDVHPVTLSYRADLFEEAGVDLESAKTWPEFQEKCLAFQRYWADRGYPRRHAMELREASSEFLTIMLLQRHVNIVDEKEDLHIDDPKVAGTMAFYAGLVAGPRKIGADSSGGTGLWARDVERGNLCAFITPDWRVNYLREYASSVSGKLRMMPLPRFDPDDAPTSTWGGTMIGIPKDCKNPDEAWKLIEYLFFSEAGLEARRTESDILPPLIELWDRPQYQQPEPFYGGQRVMKLYTQLGGQIPPRYVTPVTGMASSTLAVVLTRATDYLRRNGPEGLEEACASWLAEARTDIEARMNHTRFEEQHSKADGADDGGDRDGRP